MKQEIQEYLDKFQRKVENNSLDAMKNLMQKLGNPEKECKIIHIAGTNGKGSVLEMLNSILQKQGYRVGKFISPHLIEFNERICINNKQISDEELNKIIEYLKPIVEEYNKKTKAMPIRHFDIITAIAFIYFAKNKCDFVLLETGMGGLLDSTNVATPILSIITTIGYDHMKTLGNTLKEIATHKAGIIKPNSDTIFLELENEKENADVLNIIKQKCKTENNNLHYIKRNEIKNYSYNSQNCKFNNEYQYFDYNNYLQIAINLKGKVQIYNAAICIKAIELLNKKGYKITEEAIRYGLKNTVHLGRFELLNKNPDIIYDGAHNTPAIENFIKNMEQYYKEKEKIYIVAILKKKDYSKILKILSQDTKATIYVTSGNDENLYCTKETLYEEAKKYTNKVKKMELEQAICEVTKENPNKVIAIIGTFYIYGNVTFSLQLKKILYKS